MLILRQKTFFSFFILLITFMSVSQWSIIPIGNTVIYWIFCFLTIFLLFHIKKKNFHPSNQKDYLIVFVYLIWMTIGCIRGILIADGYWEWKQLITGALALSLPVFTYVFSIPKILHDVLHVWIKYAIPLFFLVFIWIIGTESYQFYLGPIFLIVCFLPIIPKKWRYIFILLLLLMLFANWGARSQVIKSFFTLCMSACILFHKFFTNKILKFLHWTFYILPIILLFLGISGQFNIFEDLSKNEGKAVERKMVNGQWVEEDLSADTRTFIYEEVIGSAIRHNYIWFGRTPARGNDSMSFGSYSAENLKTGKYERHSNEVCHPNIFTWLGLVGVILYSLIYLKSSYLAVYKSNNIYIKILGVFIAFRWAYGWVEDFNRFDIMNISLWMMIAMGFSEQFRNMTDQDFKVWIRSIF